MPTSIPQITAFGLTLVIFGIPILAVILPNPNDQKQNAVREKGFRTLAIIGFIFLACKALGF